MSDKTVAQGGFTMVVGPFLQLKLIPQQTVRAPADPRYPIKIARQGAFNWVLSIFWDISPVFFKNEGSKF